MSDSDIQIIDGGEKSGNNSRWAIGMMGGLILAALTSRLIIDGKTSPK